MLRATPYIVAKHSPHIEPKDTRSSDMRSGEAPEERVSGIQLRLPSTPMKGTAKAKGKIPARRSA
jgi:hypothetical protein